MESAFRMTDLTAQIDTHFACSKCGGAPNIHGWIGQVWLIDSQCRLKEPEVRIVVERGKQSVEFSCLPGEIESVLPKVRDAILGQK